MSVNDYMKIAQDVTGTLPEVGAVRDRSEQVNLGMDFAKRQAEKAAPESPKIPSMGAVPLAN